MAERKSGVPRKRRSKATLPASVVGLSLSLAGAACTQSSAANAQPEVEPVQVLPIDLREVEVVEVTLATFHAFDREDATRPPPEEGRLRLAYCRGCGTCYGCRSCRCYYCRSCRCWRG